MLGQMAIARALLGFNDVGGSVTPFFSFEKSFSLPIFYSYINLLTHRSAVEADPPSQRMPWEDCRAVPSHQLPHVSCGAGT